ncbi:TetR/AcrR family transcriptional regulator [Butyrivibrio sp. AE2032]|uniref:TetR/AcrR family transcriptional regulator n=1 Tax=Butyrivibrio sp. AE2032 TaxID=1458463 RepID=UPI000552F525|nr:TetR-like C-terminal domain-containing protein [Butyrivibrio sp. AE2032]
MEEKKPDRRSRKTQTAICNVLMELLTQKELRKVTVQEITDKADINRATFYKHYLDVYDLYDKLEQDILIEWGMLVLKLAELRTAEFFKSLVDYVDKNRLVFKMVFSENSPGMLRTKFEKLLEGLLMQIEAEKTLTDIKDIKLSYQTSYRAQGCIAILTRWVDDGFDQPKDFIFKVLAELDANTEKIM